MRVLTIDKSRNSKLGPIPATYTSAESCPDVCPLKDGGGCYAESGNVAIHWSRLTAGDTGRTWSSFIKWVKALPAGTLWRHDVAGDLPHKRGIIDRNKLAALVHANRGKRGFTFSHHDLSKAENRGLIRAANRNGFTINLSGNNPSHADELAALDIGPVVTIVPADWNKKTSSTPAGRTIRQCPATYADTTCKRCAWCSKADRDWIVAFPAHGARRARASNIAGCEK